MEPFELALGLLILALVFWDVFQTIVVPRPTPGRFRLGRYLIRGAWRVARGTAGPEVGGTRDRLLGLFAPAATIFLLAAWLSGLILGYGLILFALRAELQPTPHDLGTALYFAASSILTLGFGDIVAIGAIARIVVVAAAASGLGIVALVVTFLFSLFGSYQRREVSVVTLEAKAGVPPSAVVLLESLARMDLVARLPEFFGDWERWAAEVLDSHVAYPLLGYFRSSHDNLSWISALGTVLDTASLVLTTIRDVPRGHAELAKRVGSHLVEDITNLGFRSGGSVGIDRPAFDTVFARLLDAGYDLMPADEAWEAFSAARATYAPGLEAMATYWAVPSASWFGGSEPLRSPTHERRDPA
jgi:Ion channel